MNYPFKISKIIALLQNVILLLVSIAIGILLMEGLVRCLFASAEIKNPIILDPTAKIYAHELTPYNLRLRYKPTPYASQTVNGIIHQFNSTGLRDREYNISKPDRVKRILFLGDSIVYGHAIKLDESIPKQLEKIYIKNNQPVEVLNLGVSGYETDQEVEFLKEVGLKYAPDLVLLGYCLNDSNYASFEMDWFHAKLDARVKDWHGSPYRKTLQILYQHSKLLNLLDRNIKLRNRFRFLRPYSEKGIFDYVQEESEREQDSADSAYAQLKEKIIEDAGKLGTSPESLNHILTNLGFKPADVISSHHWNTTKVALLELKELSKRHGFKVAIVLFPFLQEIDHYPLESLHLFLRAEFKSMGFPMIRMREWAITTSKENILSRDGIHFTPLGAQLTAAYLYDQLESLNLL